jgi:hypothetical protein
VLSTGSSAILVRLGSLADLRATYQETIPQKTWAAALDVVRLMLENWFEKPAESIFPLPLVNGDDLMREFNFQPGKQIGEMLEVIKEAQAIGAVNTREDALKIARERIKQ